MKWIVILLVLLGALLLAHPAEAAFCRHFNDHLICIIAIKRSAKYHWEYRADISIDGVKQPTERYNCRDRIKVRQDGTVVSFKPNSAGELMCSLLHR